MRKLASIQTVGWVSPIEGKDRIELIGVLGYQVIVKKDEFKVGDPVVFVEPDSVLPEREEFEFLRKNKFRIKTLKLSQVISQGICFPLSILPSGKDCKLDDDVTEIMGIKQYDKTIDVDPVVNEKKPKNPVVKFLCRWKFFRKIFKNKKETRGFPDFISKTDECRVQVMPKILENKEIKYVVREKVDGSSSSYFLRRLPKKFRWQKDKFDFGVCSRNLRLNNEFKTPYWQIAQKYSIKDVLMQIIGDSEFVAIQGEVVAPKIQGNKYKVSEPDLYVFNLIFPKGKINCFVGEEWLADYGLKWCPLVAVGYTMPDTVNDLLNFSNGKSALCDTMREGIVLRNYDHNISFKAVSPDFLIKNDE